MKWVVAHWTCGVNGKGPASTKQYLSVINYNPYNRHDREALTTLYTDHKDEAFHFSERAAAEMGAVFVGGYVEVYEE